VGLATAYKVQKPIPTAKATLFEKEDMWVNINPEEIAEFFIADFTKNWVIKIKTCSFWY
jgi:hypothetical protein